MLVINLRKHLLSDVAGDGMVPMEKVQGD